MSNNIAKDKKLVVTFLSILSIFVLMIYISDKNIIDILYLMFLISCLIKYFLLIRK